ncbi:MAG: hypothetical protein S4CHLAM102_12710 [Chlamydiia bacterium]|nr:hypothetical protein [Chlamydiia bacterium]
MDPKVIEKHEKTIWCRFAVIFLGVWLLISHYALGYKSEVLQWSDFITGAVLIVLGFWSLSVHNAIIVWITVFVGIWLQAAPLIFWAPTSAAYLNDTMVGVLVITVSILIPGMPGIVESEGNAIPPGWSYNPSAWAQRIPTIALAFTGWMISRYLASYQLGYIPSLWDPFFGHETIEVVTSKVAKSFPVPDAGLGAFAYTLETLLGLKGGSNRWRTMPWLVVGFGFLVVPLGIVTVILVILQPLMVHAWCGLCLITASCMLILLVLAVDEVVAVIQFLHQSWKEGKPFWHTFFLGGDNPNNQQDERTPPFHTNPWRLICSAVWGAGFQWNLILQTAIGVWLMFSPSVFGLGPLASDFNHLFGALVVVLSVISQAEVIRIVRYLVIPFGLWFAIATWFINSWGSPEQWVDLGCGIALILLSFPRGKIRETYGTWQKWVR